MNTRVEATNWTPLMFAAYNGHLNVVRVLVNHRADPNLVNLLDDTALDLAVGAQNSGVQYFLEKHTRPRERSAGFSPLRVDIFEAAKTGAPQSTLLSPTRSACLI